MSFNQFLGLENSSIQVPKGLQANLPSSLRATEVPKSGAGILSGMVITKNWESARSRYEWVKGNGGDSAIPYFAFQSQDDFDVEESGMLTGLSCAGDFEITTPHFTTGGDNVYNDGAPLTFDSTTGKVKMAAAGDIIIGFVVGGLRGPIQLNPLDSSAVGGSKLYQISDSSAVAPVTVITLQTAYNGAKVPA